MKKGLTIPTLLKIAGALFALVAFGMMFLPNQYKVGTAGYFVESTDAWAYYFGDGNGAKGAVLPFVGYIAAALGAIVAIGACLVKPSKGTKLAGACAALLAIAATVFIFVGPTAYSNFNELGGLGSYVVMSTGTIVGGIFAGLAALAFIGAVLAPSKKGK